MIIFLGKDDKYKELIVRSKNDKDIVVSCQYRYKVPESLINSYPCVNIHYGVLPFYAGCNPIYWQLKKDKEAGVTLHYMDENFDSGDIIAIWKMPTQGMTADEVYDVLERKGVDLLKYYYSKIIDGTAPRRKQDLRFRKYHNKEDIDFNRAKYIKDLEEVPAVHFEGKQYPIISIDGTEYEVRRAHTCI